MFRASFSPKIYSNSASTPIKQIAKISLRTAMKEQMLTLTNEISCVFLNFPTSALSCQDL
jgi:hypothetical protein